MNDPQGEVPLNATQVNVSGMHCINCVVLVERRLAALPQVLRVTADYPGGYALITHRGELDLPTIQNALGDDGYTVSPRDPTQATVISRANTGRDYLEIAAAFLVLAGVAALLHQFNLLPRGLSVSDSMSYGLVFVIGLVASVSSCLAVTGGLLVAVAAKYSEANPQLSDRERLTPHLYFNVGRIISYTLLGGLVGMLGSALTLSPALSGGLMVLASIIMIALGLQMLKLFPSLTALLPTLPKTFAHRIHGIAARDTKGAAFALGAATFFLPCGFTQGLQLYVLAKGSSLTGALTMLAFALGTLPALLSLSAVSSFAKGAFQKHFVRLAGAAVIVLGFLNIQYGFVLTGQDIGASRAAETDTIKTSDTADTVQKAVFDGTTQRITMQIVGLDYHPNQFIVKPGVPVQWWIDASQADGCGRVLVSRGSPHPEAAVGNQHDHVEFHPRSTRRVRVQLRHGHDDPGLQDHRPAEGQGLAP